MKQAILELKKHNIDLMNLVNTYVQSNHTHFEDNTLYYKSVSEGLMFLCHYKYGHKLTFNDHFEVFGTMLDVSRGAVFKVDYIKDLIRKKALMGVNELWLYMEDVYELPEYPHFGYMRGRYTQEELEDIVNYAEIFDVKVVPTIQTLGHMEQFLRWYKSEPFKDQSNVLLTKSEETFKLIDTMLKFMKKIFKHDKIHIGLDETWGFGFGHFYKKHGYVSPVDNFFDHLNHVNHLALKNGFKDVHIWSDMPYRLLSENDYYYDPNIIIDESTVKRIPDNVTLVYWDYYNRDAERVENMVKNHKAITDKVVFASGTWIWTRFNYDKKTTEETAPVHIKAAIKHGVRAFILTQWMDDGAYGDHQSTLLGVYEMSLKALTDHEICQEVYQFITGESLEVSYNKSKINMLKMSSVGLMWDDPQYAVYLRNYTQNDLSKYEEHLEEMEKLIKQFENDSIYAYEYHIVSANYYKLLGRKMLINQYINKEPLDVTDIYEKVITHLEQLMIIFRNRWYRNYKMFGLEVVQSRLATQIYRAKEMIELTRLFNQNEIDEIEGLLNQTEIFDQPLSLKFHHLAFTTLPFN